MADLLKNNPNVATELGEIIQTVGIKGIIEDIKHVQIKKTYKVNGKKQQTTVIAKNAFANICEEKKEGGLSDDVIDSIEQVVCLTPSQVSFYQIKSVEALFNEVK